MFKYGGAGQRLVRVGCLRASTGQGQECKMNQVLELIAVREKDYPGALLEARNILQARLDNSRPDYQDDGEILSLLAEVHYWLGVFDSDGRQKESVLAEGVECGKKAALLAPDSVAANFWFANCMAAHSRVLGMKNSLIYLEPIEEHGNLALEIDETYRGAGPLRLMGRFYCTAPVPPVGPGNRKKGLQLAKRAIRLYPDDLGNQVALADAYLSARYFDESRRLARAVLTAPDPAGSALSNARYLAESRQILDRLENME